MNSYQDTTCAVKAKGSLSSWFRIITGVWIWTAFPRKYTPGSQFMEGVDPADPKCHAGKPSRRTSTNWSVGGLLRKQKLQQGTAAFGNTSHVRQVQLMHSADW